MEVREIPDAWLRSLSEHSADMHVRYSWWDGEANLLAAAFKSSSGSFLMCYAYTVPRLQVESVGQQLQRRFPEHWSQVVDAQGKIWNVIAVQSREMESTFLQQLGRGFLEIRDIIVKAGRSTSKE